MNTTENNRRRIERMDIWISEAEKASGESKAHLRFLFYWIAYEAAYQTYETEESEGSEGGHGEERVRLHRELVRHDRGRLQNILRAQKDNIVNILELRQAHPSFWKRWGDERTPGAWETTFEKRVESAKKKLNEAVGTSAAVSRSIKGTLSSTLDDVFRNLNVVRNQIVHGASAGPLSRGRTQVILGAGLLNAFIPCIRDSIEFNIDEDWGEPPFPRVGSRPDDKCPPPWLS